jgi:tRNA U34 5-methylaminomethyl-2-thiouridine-forming methyltransferase MnmC
VQSPVKKHEFSHQLTISKDGSHTLFVPELNEYYHSTFGAIQESEHVYIYAGLHAVEPEINPVSLLEMGFGTGLNVLLAALAARDLNRRIICETVELFPLGKEIREILNYPEILNIPIAGAIFRRIHEAPWGSPCRIDDGFMLTKMQSDIREIPLPENTYHVIFFDAFSPDAQPDLWTEKIFKKIFLSMKHNGALVTYSCKGEVKRTLKKTGFSIEKLPGPPGKREFLRAWKR